MHPWIDRSNEKLQELMAEKRGAWSSVNVSIAESNPPHPSTVIQDIRNIFGCCEMVSHLFLTNSMVSTASGNSFPDNTIQLRLGYVGTYLPCTLTVFKWVNIPMSPICLFSPSWLSFGRIGNNITMYETSLAWHLSREISQVNYLCLTGYDKGHK